jgi:hypothetical protein
MNTQPLPSALESNVRHDLTLLRAILAPAVVRGVDGVGGSRGGRPTLM